MHRSVRSARLALAALPLCATIATAQQNPTPRPPAPDPLRFQLMGPAGGGRVSAIVGVPGDARTWYIGNASGGVWKSNDSGVTFVPVSDKMPVQAIGALAISSSNPLMVWAGTGEAWAIRDADVMGDGVYLSADSGATWTNMGLRESGRIGRIIVHPTNPDVVFVCALGRATGPQPERGVFRTTDGGKSWQRVLFVDANTGCSGLTMDANDPQVLFAGMWQVEMHTWAMYSGGPSSAIYASRDGGATWKRLEGAGLPRSPVGKIDVAIAPNDSKRVYALIQTADQGSLWRSDDGGASWRTQNWTRAMIGRAGYYIRLAVSPANADEVFIANSTFFRSMDGGTTFRQVPWGGDNHDIWIDPKNADRFGLTDDAGARVTVNHGRGFTMVSIPNGQMYHVAIDTRTPYWLYTNRQDNGTMRGPSTLPEATASGRPVGAPSGGRGAPGRGPADSTLFREDSIRNAGGIVARDTIARRDSLRRDSIARSDSSAHRGAVVAAADSTQQDSAGGGGGGGGGFRGSTWDHGLGGCESGFTIPDPVNPDIVWSTCYGSTVTRWNAKTKLARSVSPGVHTLDSPPTETQYRCHWTPPLAIDPFDHNSVYFGCQVIFRTSDGGQTWRVISPDLSTRDSSRIVSSGGVVGDNLGQFYGEVVFAIAPSEIRRGLIWAGTNDGQLWYTTDAGGHWTNVSKNMTGLAAWGTIRKIEPSHFDPATAYVAVDYHMMDDRKPYVLKTTDYGKTWRSITGDLPADHPLDYVLAVTENPDRRGMLFAGTGHAFYYSLDDGGHWTRYTEGLPAAPVTWVVVAKKWHDVIVSTYGRGVFILRDVTPLERGTELAAGEDVRLYPPHPGLREARSGRADITFALRTATPKPAKVEIVDAGGKALRSMTVRTRAGINRATWDLRYDGPKRVDLRTTPQENPHIWDEPRFKGKKVRPITHWGIEGPLVTGPIAVPGRYTVRLTVGDKKWTQPLTVLRDADIQAPDSDLVASTAAQLRIRDAMNDAVDMINKVEVMRKQVEDQRSTHAGEADITAALDDLDRKMLAVELQLLTRSDLRSDDKYYVEQYKVYLNLIWLSGEVGSGAGDVAGGAEYRPTAASMAVLRDIERKEAAAKADFDKLMKMDVPAFNRMMAGKVEAIAAN